MDEINKHSNILEGFISDILRKKLGLNTSVNNTKNKINNSTKFRIQNITRQIKSNEQYVEKLEIQIKIVKDRISNLKNTKERLLQR